MEQEIDTEGLRLVRRTGLYNVYYDEVLKRCVLHSSYFTSGVDASSAGIGVDTFACDPSSFPPVPKGKK